MSTISRKVYDSVLSTIVPTKQERESAAAEIKRFLTKLNSCLRDSRAIVGGSMAKNTWIRGIYDVDIFVQFPYSYSKRSDGLSDILEKQLKKKFKAMSRLHGSRDYFQIKEGFITYEIIPILKINRASQAQNITDISPLHAIWVNKNVKDADQIRLAKAFAKAQDVYGAESYLKGLSGYVLEILTIHYGSFDKLVRVASKWKPKTIIDIKKYHKDVIFELNKSKIASPLILIDPVQAGRNTAASLSMEKYERFVCVCKAFLESPSAEFFVKKEVTKEGLQKQAGKDTLIFCQVTPFPGKEDVVGCKLLKAFNFLKAKFEQHDFTVVSAGWDFDAKSVFWFIVRPASLPAAKEWPGPPLKATSYVDAFKKKHKKSYVKGDRIFATIQRIYKIPRALVEVESKNPYLKDKIKRITIQ